MRTTQVKLVVGGAIVFGAILWLALSGFDESKAYFKTVPELAAMGAEAQGKRIKVAGDVKAGTLNRDPHRTTFVLTLEGSDLPVVYTGKAVLPDTFKEGAKVVADGRLRPDGTFEAKQIQAKCASKYEAGYPSGEMPEAMRRAIERGEAPPEGHGGP
ncbi:MAG: cytochrome c maturation protein CcmE [Nitrospirae bacterium]|nr:MAG: cytochrome c maturation protein CcmE [Nitrospirota bacterium]